MKKIGFAVLGIITAVALTVPVMAQDGSDKKAEKQHKKGGKGEFFKKADTNGDGKLSPEEFKAAVTKGDAEKKFADADTNKDGFLTPEELKAAHEKHADGGTHGKPAKECKTDKPAPEAGK